jgi:hypothetical protein
LVLLGSATVKFPSHLNHSNHLNLSSKIIVGQRGLEPRTSVL